MSRIVKSFYGSHTTLTTLISRIAIVVLLLVDSLRGNRIGNRDNVDNRQRSVFEFHNSEFDVSFGVLSSKDPNHRMSKSMRTSDHEIINNAIDEGILYPPDGGDAYGGGTLKPRIGDGTDPDMFRPNVPEECMDKLICDKDESYPTEAVDKVIEDLKDFQVLAGVDKEQIGDRSSDDGSRNLCGTSERVWFPRAIRQSRIEPWHRVVNGQKFEVGFRVGHCLGGEGQECSNSFGLVAEGQTMICKQQYSYRQVTVVDPNNGTVFANLFPIASGCCCHAKSIGFARDSRQLRLRFGNNRERSKKRN